MNLKKKEEQGWAGVPVSASLRAWAGGPVQAARTSIFFGVNLMFVGVMNFGQIKKITIPFYSERII